MAQGSPGALLGTSDGELHGWWGSGRAVQTRRVAGWRRRNLSAGEYGNERREGENRAVGEGHGSQRIPVVMTLKAGTAERCKPDRGSYERVLPPAPPLGAWVSPAKGLPRVLA